jgi:hypothetical protein
MRAPKIKITMQAKVIGTGELVEWAASGEPDYTGLQQKKYHPADLHDVHVKGGPARRAAMED